MRGALPVLLPVSLVFLAVAARAERPAVVVTPGTERSFRAAIQRFADLSPEADPQRGARFQQEVSRALEFSGLFRAIDPKAFLGPAVTSSLASGPPVVCSEWTTIGADALVEGRLDVQANLRTIEFRVWDVARCGRLLRKRYTQDVSESPTAIAKRIADDIVAAFTGVRGVASTEIAYVSDRSGHPEIWVMDADGSSARAATANRSINKFPDWSPDGDAIVYTSYRYQRRPNLFLSTRGRGRPGRLLEQLGDRLSLYRGSFGPSGQELAVVVSDDGHSDIYTVRPDGRELRRLTQNGSIDISPTWSPDGARLAFVSDRSGSPQVYLMNADGSDTRRLTYNGGYNTAPAWSPDGRWIAYESRVGGQFDIWLIDPEGEVNVPIVTHPRSDEGPSFSPDSRKLAFSSTRRGRADLYVVDLFGDAEPLQLTSGAGNNTSPSWGPFPR